MQGYELKAEEVEKRKNKVDVDLFKFHDSCDKCAASLCPCEVCGTVFGFICSGLSKMISAWRQQK